MGAHAGAGGFLHRLGVGFLFRAPVGDGPALRQIAMQRIMGAGLVGHDIGAGAALFHAGQQFGEDIGGIAQKAHRFRLALRRPIGNQRQRLVQCPGLGVHIAGADAEIDPRLVAFHGQTAGPGHHGGQRLRPAHAAQAPRQNPAPLQAAAIMLAAGFGEGLIGALHDALGADIDPGPGGHLAVHGQTLLIQLVEMVPGRPMRHQIGIGDQHAGRVLVGAEHAHRLARLHKQGFIVVQRLQRGDDAVEILPRPGGAADAAVDHQLMRVFGDIRVQVVHQHPHGRFSQPAFRGDLGAGGGEDIAQVVAGVCHREAPGLGGRAGGFAPRSHRVVNRWRPDGRPRRIFQNRQWGRSVPAASASAPLATRAAALAISGAR